jgi:hypothetical protein
MPNDCLEVTDERIVMGSGTVQHAPIPLNHLRVCIDIVYDDCQEYEVPYPTKDSNFLVELIKKFPYMAFISCASNSECIFKLCFNFIT